MTPTSRLKSFQDPSRLIAMTFALKSLDRMITSKQSVQKADAFRRVEQIRVLVQDHEKVVKALRRIVRIKE